MSGTGNARLNAKFLRVMLLVRVSGDILQIIKEIIHNHYFTACIIESKLVNIILVSVFYAVKYKDKKIPQHFYIPAPFS